MSEVLPIIIPLVFGVISILVSSKLVDKRKKIIQNGIEVEGIIFDYETSYSTLNSVNNSLIQCPIIRFVTKEGLWITKQSDIGFAFRFKKNKKVTVVYDQNNPEDFIWKTSFDLNKLVYLFLYAGIILLLVGIWLGYKYLTKPN
jgi:hypothetical protein